MMYNEFCELLDEHTVKPTLEDYKIIETVYMYHPVIGDKKCIAELYDDFGMILMKDMYPRADSIRSMQIALDTIKSEYINKMDEIEKKLQLLQE